MSAIALQEHTFKRSMLTRIQNFGFELEMLTPEDSGEHEPDEEWDECSECYGDGRVTETQGEGDDEIEVEVTCPECGGDGGSYYYPEYDGASDRLESLVSAMRSAGLVHRSLYGSDIHAYHCDCRICEHTRHEPFLAAQQDCTVGVEFITKICSVHSKEDTDNIAKVVDVVNGFRSWMANGWDEDGNHVHVSVSGADDEDGVRFSRARREQAHRLANLVYATYDWDRAADGACGRLRGYNEKPGTSEYGTGSWLRFGSATFEHRLWNTPAVGERIFGHVGVSLALTRWAFASTFNHPILDARPVSNLDIHQSLEKHRDRIITDIASYLPEGEYGKQGANVLELVS